MADIIDTICEAWVNAWEQNRVAEKVERIKDEIIEQFGGART